MEEDDTFEFQKAAAWKVGLSPADLDKKQLQEVRLMGWTYTMSMGMISFEGMTVREVWGYHCAWQNLEMQKMKRELYSYANVDTFQYVCSVFNYGRDVYL